MNGFRSRVGVWMAVAGLVLGGTAGAVAQDFLQPAGFGAAGDSPVSVSAVIIPAQSGKPPHLQITAEVADEWHIFSITQPKGGPIGTTIKVPAQPNVELAGGLIAVTKPKVLYTWPGKPELALEEHEGKAIWVAPLKVAAGVEVATLKVAGSVNVQACHDKEGCKPPKTFKFEAALDPQAKLPEIPADATSRAVTPTPEEKTPAVPEPAKTATSPATPASPRGGPYEAFGERPLVIADLAEISDSSLLQAMGLAFLGGLILNLMPCVLPVIGLKVLSFVEQAGQDRGRIWMLNVWYSAGMMAVFMLLASLAAFANQAWGQLSTYPEFNIAMGCVIFVMALSFLGVWEIPIPGFATSNTAIDASEMEGYTGAFFKGCITTVLATPCSGPFLGSALVWTVGKSAAEVFTVFAAIGLGMASPYLLIGAFPQLIRFLPKPGAWMDSFKHIMGFVLLGTVVYLLALTPWHAIVPSVALLFGLWGACWWIGRVPLYAEFNKRMAAWVEGAAFAGVVWLFCFPGFQVIFRDSGWVGLSDIMAHRYDRDFAQEVAARGGSVPAPAGGDQQHVPWEPFSREKLVEHTRQGKTVVVDFTADWCQTCKVLEAWVLNTPEVVSAVKQNKVVALVADWTRPNDEIERLLDELKSNQIPVLAIFPAGKANQPTVLRGSYTQETLLAKLAQAGPSIDPAKSSSTAAKPGANDTSAVR